MKLDEDRDAVARWQNVRVLQQGVFAFQLDLTWDDLGIQSAGFIIL